MENGSRGQIEERLVRGLGWFSIGLGVAEIVAPRSLGRLIGTKTSPGLMRLLGVREVASGIGILSQPRPRNWVWARVGGDAMDLALLGTALASRGARRGRLATAAAAVAGVTALDVICGQKLRHGNGTQGGGIRVQRAITVNRSREEMYHFWHNFESLPKFMNHLESIQVTGEKRSHWVVKAPAGMKVEWDAEIIEDKPNELISWRSLEGADVDHAGSVRFEPARGGRGTVIRVKMQYYPPAGVLGGKLAKLFGESPDKQMAVDLYRFKQMLETGEIARTEGQPAGGGRPQGISRKYDEMVRT